MAEREAKEEKKKEEKKKEKKKEEKKKEDEPDLCVVRDKWMSCQLADGDIDTKCYMDAYREFGRFMSKMGFLFVFVVKDINEKLGILEKVLSQSPIEYGTVNGLFMREVAQGRVRKESSGTLALVRLHRAMEFVLLLIQAIHDEDDETKMGPVVRQIYEDTLAKRLPWYINGSVQAGLSTLKKRKEFLNGRPGSLLRQQELKDIEETIEQGQKVYQRVQVYVVNSSLQDLPQH